MSILLWYAMFQEAWTPGFSYYITIQNSIRLDNQGGIWALITMRALVSPPPQCWPLNSLWPEIHELRRFVRMVAEWDSILRSLRYWDGLHKDTISPETSRLVESPKIFRAISDHSLSAIFDDIDFLFTSPRGWYRLTPWRYTCRDRLEQEEGLTSTSDGQRLFWWRGMHPLSKG